MIKCHYWTFVPGLKVKLPQCSEKGASAGWWVILLKSIEHELIFLAQSKLIAFIWLLVLAGLNLLIQVESSPSDDGFCMFLLPSARSFPEFGTTPLVRTPPATKSDAASEMLCPVPWRDAFLAGWLKRNNQRFSKQKWDGNRMAILTKLWTDVPFRGFVPSDAQARSRLRSSCSFPSQNFFAATAPLFAACTERFEICAAQNFPPASGVLTSSLGRLGVRVRRFFWGCRAGCRLRCRLMISWWCDVVCICNDAKVEVLYRFCCCFASWSRPCDVIDARIEVGVIKDSLFDFHPAPRFVKERYINMLA